MSGQTFEQTVVEELRSYLEEVLPPTVLAELADKIVDALGLAGIPAFEDDPVAMAFGFTPRKEGVLIPGEPEHCHLCALKVVDALRAALAQRTAS